MIDLLYGMMMRRATMLHDGGGSGAGTVEDLWT